MQNRQYQRLSPYQKAVKWLKRAKNLKRSIDFKEILVSRKRASVERIKPPLRKDYVKVQKSAPGDYVGDTCAEIADLEADTKRMGEDLKTVRLEIKLAIDELENDREKQVLYGRYLEYMTYEQIARKYGMDERYAYRAHNKAVNRIAVMMF